MTLIVPRPRALIAVTLIALPNLSDAVAAQPYPSIGSSNALSGQSGE